MGKRNTNQGPAGGGEFESLPAPQRAARVLIVEQDGPARRELIHALHDPSLQCEAVGTLAEAIAAADKAEYDAAVAPLTLPDGEGLTLLKHFESRARHTKTVLLADRPLVSDAVEAMRHGAVDLLAYPVGQAELLASVVSAVRKARLEKRQAQRVDRLRRLCRRLHSSQQTISDQVDTLCSDLVGAYEELAEKVEAKPAGRAPIPTGADDFESRLEGDLDIESLLRTALEQMLIKTGPTNAAVFLPCNHSDFNLGAYVNYDCPRDAVDILLDQLADLLAPRLQCETGIVRLADGGQVHKWLGEEPGWLSEYGLVAFACRADEECLAVIAFFRDPAKPFTAEKAAELKTMGDSLARQLARVVRIHHRHMPDHEWSGWFEEDDDGPTA